MTDEELRDLMARLRQSNAVFERKRAAVTTAPAQTPPAPKPSVASRVARRVGNLLTAVFWCVVVTVTIIAFVTDTRLILAIGLAIIFFGYINR